MAVTPGTDFTAAEGTGGFEGLRKAFKSASDDALTLDTTVTILTSIEKKVLDIQKGLTDGVVVGAKEFRERLTEAYINTQNIGASFKDVTEIAAGVGTSLGKAITPSKEILENLIAFGKATGMSNQELNTAYSSFVKIGITQKESLEILQNTAILARQSGLDTKDVLTDISKNLQSVESMGFSNGIEGLTKMAIEAKSLNSSIEAIGAIKLAETLWDPAKAIELSQKMQMYGGEVGNLGNSFELMRKGAYDVEGLNEDILTLFEKAFEYDEKTGKLESSGQVGRQQIKAYADALGVGYNEAVKLGQERKEAAIIEEKIAGMGVNPEQMNLIKSLGQLGPGGKIELSIPGFQSFEDITNLSTTEQTSLLSSLEEYSRTAKLSDRELAEQNISIQDKQLLAQQQIRETLFRDLNPEERQKVLNATMEVKDAVQIGYETRTNTALDTVNAKGLITSSADFINLLSDQLRSEAPDMSSFLSSTGTSRYGSTIGTSGDYLSTEQPFTGSKLITGEKGTIKEMIFDKEDDFLAAPRLNEILNKAKMSFDTAYALNDIIPKPLVENTKDMGETFAQTETKITTTNTNEIKFDPLVIKIEGVDGKLKDMLSSYENSKLMSDLIIEQFAKMPKLMGNKGVFG
jgi:hypothetical protein